MHHTECHHASFVFPVRRCHNCNKSILLRTFTLSPSSLTTNRQLQPTGAFAKSHVHTDIVRTKTLLLILIFVTSCFWRLSHVSGEFTQKYLKPKQNSDLYNKRFDPSTLYPVQSDNTMAYLVDIGAPQSKFVPQNSETMGSRTSRSSSHENSSIHPTDIKLINSELIRFICYRLPDPCARAAYLRRHTRHQNCPYLPLLYLLPHAVNRRNVSQLVHYVAPCDGGLPNLPFAKSDSFFEPWLHPSDSCERNLIRLQQLMAAKISAELMGFNELLERSFCKKRADSDYNITGEFRCGECRTAYTNWLCATEFPLFYPFENLDTQLGLDAELRVPSNATTLQTAAATTVPSPSLRPQLNPNRIMRRTDSTHSNSINTNRSTSRDRRGHSRVKFHLFLLRSCFSSCTLVETVCPYFNPHDSTSNGGEPAFLCDESHYHHSSRYGDFYLRKQQCEVDCCLTDSDLLALSYGSVDSSDPHTSIFEQRSNDSSCQLTLPYRCAQLVTTPYEYTATSRVLTSHSSLLNPTSPIRNSGLSLQTTNCILLYFVLCISCLIYSTPWWFAPQYLTSAHVSLTTAQPCLRHLRAHSFSHHLSRVHCQTTTVTESIPLRTLNVSLTQSPVSRVPVI